MGRIFDTIDEAFAWGVCIGLAVAVLLIAAIR